MRTNCVRSFTSLCGGSSDGDNETQIRFNNFQVPENGERADSHPRKRIQLAVIYGPRESLLLDEVGSLRSDGSGRCVIFDVQWAF
jgi:hypothetical protein